LLGFRAGMVALVFFAALKSSGGYAVEVVDARLDKDEIDLTEFSDLYQTEGDRIVVPTAPAADGIARRMEVRGEKGTHWAVVALANNGEEQIDRLLVAPRFKLDSVGLLVPVSAQSNIVAVTPSSGERPKPVFADTDDVYRLTLDPASVVTYAIELRSDRVPPLYLWDGDAYYRAKFASITLYYRIAVVIATLLLLIGAARIVASWQKRSSRP
jgi:hypothetical protein